MGVAGQHGMRIGEACSLSTRFASAAGGAWFRDKTLHYACEQCGTLNSAYHPRCRSCGATPSCSYVKLHSDEVLRFMANLNQSC
jgi:hypothetical protein